MAGLRQGAAARVYSISSSRALRRAANKGKIKRIDTRNNITETADAIPAGAVQLVHHEATAALPIADVIDIDQEKARLQSAIAKSDGEIGKLEKKLGNRQFLAKAPEEVVEEQRERLVESHSTRARLVDALERLSAAV